MSEIYTSLSISLIARRNFVIHTRDYNQTLAHTNEVIGPLFEPDQTGVIDLLAQVQNEPNQEVAIQNIAREMLVKQEDGTYRLKTILIWKNLEFVPAEFQRHRLNRLLDEINEFDTVESRLKRNDFIRVSGLGPIHKPSLFCIVPIVTIGNTRRKFDQYLKQHFWFSQLDFHPPLTTEHESYLETIYKLRSMMRQVFASPDIQRYVYSLVIFTRTHRLCLLAPIETRVPTGTIDSIETLAKCLVLWQQYLKKLDPPRLFVTPEFCKVAYRKIGYWLVDWETNNLFNDPAPDETTEALKKLEINVLTGDWYASEYHYVKKYLEKYRSLQDESSSVGFLNLLVEDVLDSVRPPI